MTPHQWAAVIFGLGALLVILATYLLDKE